MADEPLFTELDAATLQRNLLDLLCRTAREKGRIHITNCQGEDCVVLSKAELDGLENALEIMFQTAGARQVEQRIEQFAMLIDAEEPRKSGSAE